MSAPYLMSIANYTHEEILESAKTDKLVLSNDEFKELFVERVKRLFDKESDVRYVYNRITTYLFERINNKIPICIDNFGSILKIPRKHSNRYDVITKEHVYTECYLAKFICDKNFRKYFLNKENRQVLKEKIMRRTVTFVKEYGKVKLIGF